jgi:hypothetical protein
VRCGSGRNSAVALAVVFTALLAPFRLGFSVPFYTGGLIMDVALFMVFVVDISVRCNTAFTNAEGLLVRTRDVIVRHYARTWLVMDVLLALPVESLQVFHVDGVVLRYAIIWAWRLLVGGS